MYPILSLPIQYAKLHFIGHHIITPWCEAFGIELIMLWLSFQDYFSEAIFEQKKMIEKEEEEETLCAHWQAELVDAKARFGSKGEAKGLLLCRLQGSKLINLGSLS